MKKSFINILSGGLGFALPMVLNIFFTPIIVKNLGSEAYGLQSLVNVIIGFLMIADMGLDIPVTRAIAEYKSLNEPTKLNNLLNTSLILYLIIGVIGAIIIGISAPFLIDYAFKVPQNLRLQGINVFYLAGVGFVGGLLSMWGKSIFNGLLRYDISNGINVISNFLSLIVGVLLVINGYGVVSYVFCRVIFTFLTGIAYLVVSRKFLPSFKFSFIFDKDVWGLLRKQVGYGFFLRMSGILTSRIDQTLIGIWIGMAAVGYYSIPILITTSLAGLIGSMIHYIFPSISELHASGKHKEVELLYYRGSKFIGILAFAIFIPFVLLGPNFLKIWVGEIIYQNSSVVFILLLIATFLQLLIVSILNCYIVGIGKIKFFTGYTLVRSIFMSVGCIILIKYFGLIGAGWAMIITVLVDILYYYISVKKYLHSDVHLLIIKFYLKLSVSSLVPFLVIKLWLLDKIHNWFGIGLAGISYLFVFLAFTVIFKSWDEEEIEFLKRIFFKIAPRNKN